MAQDRQQAGKRQPLTNGIDPAAEWRSCGLYALLLLGMLLLPLSAIAAYLIPQHQPVGDILLSVIWLIFALVGLSPVLYVLLRLHCESFSLRTWYAGLFLFLCGVAYDSLAHIWWKGPLPTFDQLLPDDSAGFMRQAVWAVMGIWLIAPQFIQMVRDARQRRLSAPPPSS